jgi:hypothetical protein
MRKYSAEDRFLKTWLCSAAVVTVLRFLNAEAPGYDLALQIEAAHNLLAGNGLSLYRQAGSDLAGPATLITLTHFPSGYSLCAAALMAIGVSVGMVVKVLGAAGTMLGWWGWGKLAYPFFSEGLKRSPVWKWAAFAIAVSSPLLFTIWWGGTDIFLWAAVPWVLNWVVRAADENAIRGRWFDGLAGALCGLCVLMRYASLFLAVYVAFLMLWQSRMRFQVLTRRWGFFGLALLPALAVQVSIILFRSNAPEIGVGGLSLNHGLGFAVRRVWDGVPLLSTANYPWVFWLSWRGLNGLFSSEVAGPLPWQLGITLATLVLLVLLVKTYGVGLLAASRDPRIVPLGLFVALPLVLWGCMTLGYNDYLADQRYYWPLVPLSVFVFYSLASLTDVPKRKRLTRVLQRFGVFYLTGYIAMSLAYMVFFFLPGERGTNQRQKLMANELRHWPSMSVTYEFSPARRFVMRLLNGQPDTLLLTSKAGWFYWDPTVDRSRLYELNCQRLQATYLSGPARIIILTFDDGRPLELWYPVGCMNGMNDKCESLRADCFERLPDLKLLQRFPEERVKVLETRVPAGMRVNLKVVPPVRQ